MGYTIDWTENMTDMIDIFEKTLKINVSTVFRSALKKTGTEAGQKKKWLSFLTALWNLCHRRHGS